MPVPRPTYVLHLLLRAILPPCPPPAPPPRSRARHVLGLGGRRRGEHAQGIASQYRVCTLKQTSLLTFNVERWSACPATPSCRTTGPVREAFPNLPDGLFWPGRLRRLRGDSSSDGDGRDQGNNTATVRLAAAVGPAAARPPCRLQLRYQ